jgi:hypothetical protein
MARGWGQYQREVLFYRDIAATVAMRTPKPYVAEFDPATQRFVLVMEDLAPAADGNQTVGLTLDHARLALAEIAVLHATWWNRPELAGLEAAIKPFGEGPWAGLESVTPPPGRPSTNSSPAGPSPEMRRVSERMADTVEPMMRDMARVRGRSATATFAPTT